MRRHLLGLCGILALLFAAYAYATGRAWEGQEFAAGTALKSGLVLVAAWLAFPQLDRLPGWMIASTLGTVLVVAMRPRIVIIFTRIAIYLVPLFAAIWCLRRLAPADRRSPPR